MSPLGRRLAVGAAIVCAAAIAFLVAAGVHGAGELVIGAAALVVLVALGSLMRSGPIGDQGARDGAEAVDAGAGGARPDGGAP